MSGVMRVSLVALLLALVAGCGGGSSADNTERPLPENRIPPGAGNQGQGR